LFKDDESLFEMIRDTSTQANYRYDPIEINKNMLRKAKKQALSNLENNPIVKEVIYTKMSNQSLNLDLVNSGLVPEDSNESMEDATLEQGHEVHTVISAGTDENESKRRPISFARENLFIKVEDNEPREQFLSTKEIILPIKAKEEKQVLVKKNQLSSRAKI
jgi:hypothetical protein